MSRRLQAHLATSIFALSIFIWFAIVFLVFVYPKFFALWEDMDYEMSWYQSALRWLGAWLTGGLSDNQLIPGTFLIGPPLFIATIGSLIWCIMLRMLKRQTNPPSAAPA